MAITASLVGVIAARYFAIQAALPGASSKLIEKIEETLGWLSPPDGATIHGPNEHVPQDAMDGFLACAWPRQKSSLEKAWNTYRSASSQDEKATALKVLLSLVRNISGRKK